MEKEIHNISQGFLHREETLTIKQLTELRLSSGKAGVLLFKKTIYINTCFGKILRDLEFAFA